MIKIKVMKVLHSTSSGSPGVTRPFLLGTVEISAAFLIPSFLIKNKNVPEVGITSLGFPSFQAFSP